jgi:membrane protease YdiL (CAAX protease family)
MSAASSKIMKLTQSQHQPPLPPGIKTQTPHSRKSGKFGPLSAILVTLGAFFGSQILAGLVIGAVLYLSGNPNAEAIEKFSDSTSGQFLFVLMVEAIALAILFWFIRRRGITLKEIGLGRGANSGDLGYALISFAVYFVILLMVLAAVGSLVPEIDLKQEQQIGFKSAYGTGALALVFISLVVLPPIAEEIMIRGFFYSGLRKKLKRLLAALLASLVFAVAHLQLGTGAPPLYVAAIDTFVLSLVLIGLRERTGSLWSGMMVHALKNGLAFAAIFIFHLQ